MRPRKRVLTPRISADAAPKLDIFAPVYEKQLVTVQVPNGMWRIKFEGGGELPDVLKTLYTKQSYAEKAIFEWLNPRSR